MKARVAAKTERFRRAGMEFTREPKVVEVDQKTLDILLAEPMLAVEVLKEKKAEGTDDAKAGGKKGDKDEGKKG